MLSEFFLTRDNCGEVKYQREAGREVGAPGPHSLLHACAQCGQDSSTASALVSVFSAPAPSCSHGHSGFSLSLPCPFSQCSDSDKKCHLWTAMDLGFFIAMGVIGGLLGATFNCLNKRLAKYRMRNVHPKPKLVRYPRSCLSRLLRLPSPVWTRPSLLRNRPHFPHQLPGHI